MRIVLAVLVSTALQGACASLVTTTPFEPLDDLRTTSPRSLAEGGHSVPALPPTGTHWQLTLRGVEETPEDAMPQRRYEVNLVLSPTIQPRLDGAVTVDDGGRAFPISSVHPVDPGAEPGEEPEWREFLLTFELPPNYRFRSVGRATVHWGLQAQNQRVVRISSRFRRM